MLPDPRPSPESFLPAAPGAESGRRRGRLKVFLGAAPGVGKTYAMLESAQRLTREGADVVVGVVETHGRSETEQLLLGLDILPRRAVEYRGVLLQEFDLDAALLRRPQIILVDELAHANVPGARFEKRWQDVEALLEAGIDVHSTLNVQHLDSLGQVVERITGVPVGETVPDRMLDDAAEVELVDLPADNLIERLRAGKVYVPETARKALTAFFQRGNLIALRELALRKTAQWVDAQMRAHKASEGIRAIWPTGERLLVCISPSPTSRRLLNAAQRMAAPVHGEIIAAWVEPATGLTSAQQQIINEHLAKAERLGAECVSLRGGDAAGEIITLARQRNVSRIIIGKTRRSRWADRLRGSFINEIIRRSGDIDVSVITGAGSDDDPEDAHNPAARTPMLSWKSIGGAAFGIAAATLLGWLVDTPPDQSDVAMLYVAAVILAALLFGRTASVMAALLAVLAFNFFYIEPRFTLSVNDPSWLLTLAIMLGSGLLVGSLAGSVQEQRDAARQRESRTAALYGLARDLGLSRSEDEVALATARHVVASSGTDAAVFLASGATATGHQPSLALQRALHSPDWITEQERAVAQWCFDHGQPAGRGTASLPGSRGRYEPITGSDGKLGVIAVLLPEQSTGLTGDESAFLKAIARQVALACDRIRLVAQQHAARLESETERLRSALLSTVSHDLRTPLATIDGSANLLVLSPEMEPALRMELIQGIHAEARRLSELIGNLMYATRLESGAVRPRLDWLALEDVVGPAVEPLRAALAARSFRIMIPDDLPLIRADGAMLPVVLHNLLDNALRYTPASAAITVQAWATDTMVHVAVSDEGPGLAPEERTRVFRRFERGSAARRAAGTSSEPQAPAGLAPGMGLGLAICEGIIRAHGGRIWVEENRPTGGARFIFALPRSPKDDSALPDIPQADSMSQAPQA